MKISKATRDETRHETGKGQRHLKGLGRFTPPRTKTSNLSPLFHCLFLSHRERETDTRPTADRGRKPTLPIATASR